MDPISGLLSLGGGIISNLWTDKRQEDAQAFNAAQAQENRDFQERMRATAYQATMKDMSQAGLNPILAYQKGPTSSPTGAMASTSYTPASDFVTPAVNTGLAATRNKAEVENMVQTNANLQAQEQLTKMQQQQSAATTARELATAQNIGADTDLKKTQLHIVEKGAGVADIDKAFYDTTFGHYFRKYIGNTAAEVGRVLGGGSAPVSRITIPVPTSGR